MSNEQRPPSPSERSRIWLRNAFHAFVSELERAAWSSERRNETAYQELARRGRALVAEHDMAPDEERMGQGSVSTDLESLRIEFGHALEIIAREHVCPHCSTTEPGNVNRHEPSCRWHMLREGHTEQPLAAGAASGTGSAISDAALQPWPERKDEARPGGGSRYAHPAQPPSDARDEEHSERVRSSIQGRLYDLARDMRDGGQSGTSVAVDVDTEARLALHYVGPDAVEPRPAKGKDDEIESLFSDLDDAIQDDRIEQMAAIVCRLRDAVRALRMVEGKVCEICKGNGYVVIGAWPNGQDKTETCYACDDGEAP